MELHTNRLRIIPLDLVQFRILLDDIEKLEKVLGLKPSHQAMDEHTRQAMESNYKQAQENTESYLWYTNWQIILKSENVAVGSASFKGVPNVKGEVEIGYGTDPPFRNKGYMTEAIRTICSWALNQPGITGVIAETELDNVASQKVLEKSGMKRYLETENGIWWWIQVNS